ncbi:MAG: hypothetical protein KAS62_02810 [Candidatus Delongbacteria bacterium]|nr:hypothetical protein [Candidatus Delongbacteria bacterium]
MRKYFLALLVAIAVLSLSSQELLRINKPDSTSLNYDLGNVSNITFSDYTGYVLKVNKTDSTALMYSLEDISDLTFTISDLVLTTPLNPEITVSGSEANLTWEAVSGTTIYNIFRSTKPYSDFVQIGTSQTLDYQDTDVSSGSKYFYYVTAVNAKK